MLTKKIFSKKIKTNHNKYIDIIINRNKIYIKFEERSHFQVEKNN